MIEMSWDVNPLEFMTEVRADIGKKTLEIAEEVFDGVVERSPVDTGSFRASWKVGVNSPDLTMEKGGNAADPMRAPVFPNLKVTDTDVVYVTNITPYGPELENGHSQQAPSGIVALTIASLNK